MCSRSVKYAIGILIEIALKISKCVLGQGLKTNKQTNKWKIRKDWEALRVVASEL